MRRVWIGLVAAMIIALTIAGCGNSDTGVTVVTAATETSSTQAPATETSTTQAASTETSAAEAPTGADWTTLATLHSSDAPWQGMEGILMSEPFTVTGEAQLVLAMQDAGQFDGVIVAIIPADKATDAAALLSAIRDEDGVIVTLLASVPPEAVSGLDGTYVIFNSTPASKPWSLELQTRP